MFKKIAYIVMLVCCLQNVTKAEFISQGFLFPAPNSYWPFGVWNTDLPSYASNGPTADAPQYVPEAACRRLGENYRLVSTIDIDRGFLTSPENWVSAFGTYSVSSQKTGPYFHSSAYKNKEVNGELLYDPNDYIPPRGVTYKRKTGALINEWGRFQLYVPGFEYGNMALSEVIPGYEFTSTSPSQRATFGTKDSKKFTMVDITRGFAIYCIKEIK